MGRKRQYHGLSKSRLYNIWYQMTQRVNDPTSIKYEYYGGRGIKICNEWLDVTNFYRDMAPSHKEGLTLERLDVDGDYCPSNCTWVTRTQQQRNKRNNRLITFEGKTQCLTEWSIERGIPVSTINSRLYRGWTVEEAMQKRRGRSR